MAKTKADSNGRSEAITVTPENNRSKNVLAAWRGIYHLFGGRADFSVTPDGILIENFTVDSQYDPNQIVKDVSHRDRRLDFGLVYPWTQGYAPAPFTDAKEMTAWTVQFMRGAVDENSSRAPKYVHDAVAAYKVENNFAKKRGPRKKIWRAENLGEVDVETLAKLPDDEISRLEATLAAAIQARNSNTTGEGTPEPEAVTAS